MDIRVAAYGVVVDERGILLAHWVEAGLWTLPGGGLEPGEHPVDAAVREIREETGYDAAVGEVLGVDSVITPAEQRMHHPERGPLQHLQIVYRARVVGGALANEHGGSTDEAAWFPLAAVADLDRGGLVDNGLRLAGLAP